MRTMVRALYWLDRRSGVDVWFGGPGTYGRPDNAVDVVAEGRPLHAGALIEGEQVTLVESRRKAAGKVLVIGIPVPQS